MRFLDRVIIETKLQITIRSVIIAAIIVVCACAYLLTQYVWPLGDTRELCDQVRAIAEELEALGLKPEQQPQSLAEAERSCRHVPSIEDE
jgi:hypothetical protein